MKSVIEITTLSKSYKKRTSQNEFALDDLNLQIEEGEIYGFLGPNGAGKTTTIKLIMGFIFPDSGTVKVMGQSPQSIQMRSQLGFLPETAFYYRFMKVGELLDAYGKIYGMDSPARKEKIKNILEKVGLTGYENTFLREFSKGMMQRFSLAQALLNDPQLLILDEPTSGLDPIGRRDFRQIILDLNKLGVTIFFSSHELSAVEMISSRVGILNKGKLVRTGNLSELLQEQRRVKIYLYENLPKAKQDTFRQKLTAKFSNLPRELISFQEEANKSIIWLENRDYLYPVLQVMGEESLPLESIHPVRETLEELFLKTIQE